MIGAQEPLGFMQRTPGWAQHRADLGPRGGGQKGDRTEGGGDHLHLRACVCVSWTPHLFVQSTTGKHYDDDDEDENVDCKVEQSRQIGWRRRHQKQLEPVNSTAPADDC